MGKEIEKTHFKAHDFAKYRQYLTENLQTLRELLLQPGFGQGSPSFGAELELYIINAQGSPKPINIELQQQMNDKQLTIELNRFNLEYNFTPVQQQNAPFSKMKQQMNDKLKRLSAIATKQQARILPIGILPSLQLSDLGEKAITNTPRYQLLAKVLKEMRGGNFHININGEESLNIHSPDVSPEGASTSFQFHYRVNPENFADAYNAAQITSPLALALSANSPFFLGKKLWQETRIALFKQATDCRIKDYSDNRQPARVLFGLGWVRKDIYEKFAESVSLFEPLMPIYSANRPLAKPQLGQAPSLNELRLHHGSIWHWNRPIYDPTDNGHLRIELRSLPAGPSPANMLASAALMSGFMQGLPPYLTAMLAALPFRYAEQNFYRAAKYGLKARLFWPHLLSGKLQERSVINIIKELLPIAQEGLCQLGVDESEIKQQMDIINGGIDSQMNGAQWQINMFDKLITNEDRETAFSQLVEHYYCQYQTGKPVHEWSEKI